MSETRERAAIRLANQAAHLANGLTGGPPHETATDVERAQLWDALEGWRKASGIPGDGWPIREDAVLRATPASDGGEVRERALDIVDFLHGVGPLDGRWFHERPVGAGPYWWRRYLEEIRAALLSGSGSPPGEGEVVTQAEIEARWLEYVAAREALIAAAFNAGSASLHGGVHRDDIDRQGRARDRLDAAVRTLAALRSVSTGAEDRATPADVRERVLTVLTGIEWAAEDDYPDGRWYACCPWCGGGYPGDEETPPGRAGHEEMCELVAVLALLRTPRGEGEAEQGPRAAPLHRYVGQRSPEGYAVCEDCGARENTPAAARMCPVRSSEAPGEVDEWVEDDGDERSTPVFLGAAAPPLAWQLSGYDIDQAAIAGWERDREEIMRLRERGALSARDFQSVLSQLGRQIAVAVGSPLGHFWLEVPTGGTSGPRTYCDGCGVSRRAAEHFGWVECAARRGEGGGE